MRNSYYFILILLALIILNAIFFADFRSERTKKGEDMEIALRLVYELGITDLALTTEARYTRHLSTSDRVVQNMEHPGALEHFPSGSFFLPVKVNAGN